MSALYLIRHGQAGSRADYDRLSETGRTQARLLAGHLAAQRVRFQAVYSGTLRRQLETAGQARQAWPEMPEAIPDPRWNEFDLDAVYRELAPKLAAEDEAFARQWAALRSSNERRWTRCDTALVRAWVEARYPFSGESWADFGARVREALNALRARHGPGENVGVFTSATPMALVAAWSLGLGDGAVFQLAGVTYNCALTTLRLAPDELTLFLFNGAQHLPPDLRTFR